MKKPAQGPVFFFGSAGGAGGLCCFGGVFSIRRSTSSVRGVCVSGLGLLLVIWFLRQKKLIRFKYSDQLVYRLSIVQARLHSNSASVDGNQEW